MDLYQLERNFKTARTIEELNNFLRIFLQEIAITTFSFTYYSYYPNSLNKLKFDYFSENFELWHKHYLSENYEEVDSTLNVALRSSLPVYWEATQHLKNASTPREKQMRQDAIKFGAEKGLSIPIHGPQEDFATFLAVQMKGENCLEQWPKLQYKLFLVGYYYYAYLQHLLLKSQTGQKKHALTKREIQCLQLIAQECSVALMANKLNITERTVNYHIQRINKKMGTKNKHQSVAKALQKGIIHL